MYPAVILMYFVSAAVILLASLALIVQGSVPYNKTGRASVYTGYPGGNVPDFGIMFLNP